MANKNYVRQAEVSNAEFKGQLLEVIVGVIILAVGAIFYFLKTFENTEIAFLIMVVGLYIAGSGLAGVIPYGIGMFFEKGKYIAFNDEEFVLHSPKAEKCANIPLQRITKVERKKGMGIEFFGHIFGKAVGCGYIFVEYIDNDGEEDKLVFGPIEESKMFLQELNARLGK